MPTNAEVSLNIVCDNNACPGNVLDPAERTGWLFVTVEPYGSPVNSGVYCSPDCIAVEADTLSRVAESDFPPSPPPE